MKVKKNAYVQYVTKTTRGQFDKSSLQEQNIDKDVFQVSMYGLSQNL
jgi:hypothetical protein